MQSNERTAMFLPRTAPQVLRFYIAKLAWRFGRLNNGFVLTICVQVLHHAVTNPIGERARNIGSPLASRRPVSAKSSAGSVTTIVGSSARASGSSSYSARGRRVTYLATAPASRPSAYKPRRLRGRPIAVGDGAR